MSSSSTLVIFLALIFSTPVASTSSSTLIKKACSRTGGVVELELCTRVLESQPLVVSATNFFDLSVGIIKSGISNSTNTLNHVKRLLEKSGGMDPNSKVALRECKSSYSWVIASLRSALIEIVDDKEYLTASYDLLIAATDNIQECQNAVSSKGIKDKVILRGNKVVPIFGLSAVEAVESIVP